MDPVGTAETLLEGPDAERALNVCKDVLEGAGCRVEHHEEADALIAARGDGGIAFSGHVDVVPAGEGWSHEPYGNTASDGRLYGRGAADMRGPVACMLTAVGTTDHPVRVVLTTDEETTMAGVRALVREDKLSSAPLIVVGEPTGLDVATASKGVLWVRLTASGSRGHASTPRSERAASGPEALIEVLEGFPEEPIELSYPGLGGSSAALTGFRCEETPFNVLAGKAQARIDCRFPPPGTPSDVDTSLRSKLGLPRDGVSWDVVKEEPAFLGSEEHAEEIVELASGAGCDTASTTVPFASEAGHWQRVAPTVLLGPGSIDRAHGPDEFVTVTELKEGARLYRSLLEEQERFSGAA